MVLRISTYAPASTPRSGRLLDGEAGRMSYWDGDESLRSKAISPEQSELLRDGLDYFEGHRRVDGGATAE